MQYLLYMEVNNLKKCSSCKFEAATAHAAPFTCSVCQRKAMPTPFYFPNPPLPLQSHPLFAAVPIHLNEQNSVPTEQGIDWARDPINVVIVEESCPSISEGRIRLRFLRTMNLTLPSSYDPTWAILSYKWDFTNRIAEDQFLDQYSRNIAIALIKAKSLGIRFLLVDAVTLPQFNDRPLNLLSSYSKLYGTMRVITSYISYEPAGTISDETAYTSRAWILVEASKYLLNPRVMLGDIISFINDRGELISNPPSLSCAEKFLSFVIYPFNKDEEIFITSSAWSKRGLNLEEVRRTPFVNLPCCLSMLMDRDQYRLQLHWSYMMKIADSLCKVESLKAFIFDIRDLLIIICNSGLCSVPMKDFISQLTLLNDENIFHYDFYYRRHILFVAIHLLLSRHVYYRRVVVPLDFHRELIQLFDASGFPVVREFDNCNVYYLSNHMKWWMRENTSYDGRISFPDDVWSKEEVIALEEDDEEPAFRQRLSYLEGDPTRRKLKINRIIRILLALTSAAITLRSPIMKLEG